MTQVVSIQGNGHIEPGQAITAAEFVAHLKCPTKAVLLARGEKATDTSFGDIGRIISAGYKAKISDVVFIQFQALIHDPNAMMTTGGQPIYVDSETASCAISPSRADRDVAPTKTEPKNSCIPALYSAWDKVEQSDLLLVSFCALAIGQVTGAEIPGSGESFFEMPPAARSASMEIAPHAAAPSASDAPAIL